MLITQHKNMTTLIIIDMQAGLFTKDKPRHNSENVISNINTLAEAVRKNSGRVIFIQHNDPAGELFERGSDAWQLLPTLERLPDDKIVHKTACDSFYRSELKSVLDADKTGSLIITGCATDFCVDTTLRAALSYDYNIVAASDGHTTNAKPYADAETIIEHHNYLWQNLVHPVLQVKVMQTSEIVDTLAKKL